MKCRECKTEAKIMSHELIETLPARVDETDLVVKLETTCGHVYTATVFHEEKEAFASWHVDAVPVKCETCGMKDGNHDRACWKQQLHQQKLRIIRAIAVLGNECPGATVTKFLLERVTQIVKDA